jgi:hypothetical protein
MRPATSSGTPRASDPPVLVPWTRVADIRLGESAKRVESEYGKEGSRGFYRLHGSRIYVDFENGRVKAVDFSTPYYRTRSGFGVGSRIPYGPCVKTPEPVGANPCGHRWHGFLRNEFSKEKVCGCWVKVGFGKRSLRPSPAKYYGVKPWFFIYIRRGRVASFSFTLHFVD